MQTATKPRTTKPRIEVVRIEHKHDESPDYSHLGEYCADEPDSGYYVDRETGELKLGDRIIADNLGRTMGRHEYRYIAGFQHTPGGSGWSHVDDKGVFSGWLNCRYKLNRSHDPKARGNLFREHGVIGWQTAQSREEKIQCLNVVYCCEDARRLERLQQGDWCFYGIIAKAEIRLRADGPAQTIRSGGLWGIESDSGKEYFAEVEGEELHELKRELERMGFSDRQIKLAFRNVEREEA